MIPADLDRRAELTVWPQRAQARSEEGRPFATLREALAVAVEVMAARSGKPWIITEAGDILSPHWIRANAGPRNLQ